MKGLLKIVQVVGLLALVGLGIGIYFLYQLWDVSRPPVSPRKLARLNSTMDTNTVRAILGAPSSTLVFTNWLGLPSTEWTYYRPSGWKVMAIEFGVNGKFERHVED